MLYHKAYHIFNKSSTGKLCSST